MLSLTEIAGTKKTTLACLVLMLLSLQSNSTIREEPPYTEIPVGVILDLRSRVGEIVRSCIDMSIFEFYKANIDYQTRIGLHIRDTHGEPMHALSVALDLLEKHELQAIIGSESTAEANLLAVLGDEARVPILSFSPGPSSNEHPYFLQITQDEVIQFNAIAAMVESFRWKSVIVIHEDTDNGREVATYMTDEFREKGICITYRSSILTSASTEQVLEELHKLGTMRTKIFVMHMSPSLASCLLLNAEKIGLLGEGYKWIITSKTMNFLDITDGEVIESMQGAVGFKSYIPESRELRDFTSRWEKEYYTKKPTKEVKKLNNYCVWAYDAVAALAMAVEKVQTEEQVTEWSIKGLAKIGSIQRGSALLKQILKTTFHGLGGEFRLMNGKVASKALEIINVIHKEQRNVGFWTTKDAFTTEIGKTNSFSNSGLEAIIWPGGTTAAPKHRMLQTSGKKLKVGIPTQSWFGKLFNVAYDHQTGSATVGGFCADVFTTAFSELKNAVDVEYIPFTGTYNELILAVHHGDYDAAIGDITILANRSLYVDFTLPFTDLGVGTLTRDDNGSMWVFLDPVSTDLWMTSIGFFLLLGFVIWIIEHRTNEEFQGSAGQQIGTTLWFAFSTLVYAHREKLQSNLSRFVVNIWLFVVLVLTSSYTATLSSLLTVQQIHLASKRSHIGNQFGSHIEGFIVSNLNFTDSRLKPYASPEEYANALSLGSKNGGVDAIIDEIPYIKAFLSEYPSSYSMIASQTTTSGFGFVFPQGSSLAHNMSIQIARLREDGRLKMLESKWFDGASNISSGDSASKPKILKLSRLRGLFLISGVSMVLALFIFMLYFVHEKVVCCTILTRGKQAFIMRYLFQIPANATYREGQKEMEHHIDLARPG